MTGAPSGVDENRAAVAEAALVGAALVAPVTLDYMKELLAVDICLDSGGSCDYSRSACDTKLAHEFVRYADRHPAAAGMALLGDVAVVVAVVQLHGRVSARRNARDDRWVT